MFCKSVLELVKAIWRTIVWLCKTIRDFVKKYPVPVLIGVVIVLSVAEILTFAKLRATECSIDDKMWEVQKRIDTIRVNEYHKGYLEGKKEGE